MCGGFRSSAGEAVAGGTRERRLVAVSAERLGEDAAEGLIEPEALDCGARAGELCGGGGDLRGGFVEAGKRGAGLFVVAPGRTHGRGLMQWIVEGSRGRGGRF